MSQQSSSHITPTVEQAQFHATTASLISQFLRTNRLPSITINQSSFIEMCLHLNPLVHLPNMEQIDVMHDSVGYDPSISCHQPCCVICGIEVPNHRSLRLNDDDAVVFLTIEVITGRKTLQCAKQDILNEPLNICLVHIISSYRSMFETLGLTTHNIYSNRVPDINYLSGFTFFNKIRTMRQMYKDRELEELSPEQYRFMVKRWMAQYKPKLSRKPRKKVTELKKTEFTHVREERILDETNKYFPKNDENDEDDGPDTKKVKLEEPEFEEQKPSDILPSTSQQSINLPSTSQQSIISSTVSTPPSSMPKKLTVYTLKNGKKVVKAPSISPAILAKSSVKMITYRVATRKYAEVEPATSSNRIMKLSSTASYPIQQINFNSTIDDKKPDFSLLEEPLPSPTTSSQET